VTEGQLEIVMLDLDALKLDPDNPRNNSGAVEKVAESIRLFGFKVPIVVNSDGMILAGHTRYYAAALLGMAQVPCIVADDLTPEQQRAFNIADNRVANFSFFELDKLEELVAQMSDEFVAAFDLDGLVDLPIDDVDFAKESKQPEKREGLDLAPFEKYQYVTIICRSTYDYSNLLERFGLEDVQRRYVNGVMKRGSSYGRVIEYADLIKLIGPR
jgi:ParB family chromosome partitioning protein